MKKDPPFDVEVRRNVRIPMPDGVTLAADLFMPKTPGKYPAIIEYTPYHKNNNAVYGPRATRYPYFAAHGYVFVNVDIRGTGDSEGFNTGFTNPDEIRDNVDVIRWCARQSWCDGAVGMIGISYTAGVCWDAARQAPAELRAIVLCQMPSDWYSGMAYPGGTPRPFAYENYAPLMAAYNFAPPNSDLVGPTWPQIWKQRQDNSIPWGHAYLENMLDGPFWESKLLRGHHDKVQAATFLIGGWCDWYPDDFLRTFAKLRCPKRVLIGPWTHNYPENAWPLPRINDRYECLRWFDKYLKGVDTDSTRPVDKEAPVTIFLREWTPIAPLRREDAGAFIAETNWPIANFPTERHYLSADGALASRSPGSPQTRTLRYRVDAGIAAGRYVIGQMLPGWGMPDDQRLDEGLSLLYTSSPLGENAATELLGSPVAHLWLSCSAEIAFVSVKLCEVAEDGTSVLVSKGVLNLTHRDSDEKPEPLTPGKVYEVTVPLQIAGYRFRPGHRLRIMLSAADFQNAWPTPLPHALTIHHGGDQASYVELPLRRAGSAALPSPTFLPSEFAPLPPEQIPTPQYSVTRDLIKNTMTVSIRTQSGAGVNRSSYTVSIDRPAEATIRSEYDYPIERPGMSILVHSHCVTRSDDNAFHHLTQVEVKINDHLHWSKSWNVSVLRRLN